MRHLVTLLACLALTASFDALAETPDVGGAVEQSTAMSTAEKVQAAQRSIQSTVGWIDELEGEKAKAQNDRSLSDQEREDLVDCFNLILTPLREMLEAMRRSSNSMQTELAAGNPAQADRHYRAVMSVYSLAVQKKAQSAICTTGKSGKDGAAVVTMDEGEQSNIEGVEDVEIVPDFNPTPN